MLTKELLRYGLKDGKIEPHFLKRSKHWKDMAQMVLEESRSKEGAGFGELEDVWQSCQGRAGRFRKAVKGMCQVLQKKVILEDLDPTDLAEKRAVMWDQCVQSMRERKEQSSFPTTLTKAYGDLPHRLKVDSIPKWSPDRLIHRYNLALAQGLLLHADGVSLEFDHISIVQWRVIWRWLKFYGLLVTVRGKIDGAVSFEIGGALDQFGGVKRYRGRVAAILGSLAHFSKWKLRARLHLGDISGDLLLDEKVGLLSHYPHMQQSYPQEFMVFEEQLNKSLGEHWEPCEPSWPNVPMEQWRIPDLIYRRKDGFVLSLEVFFEHQKDSFVNAMERTVVSYSKGMHLVLLEQKAYKALKLNEDSKVLSFRSVPSVRKVITTLRDKTIKRNKNS
jgi:predicted nuclease of restriction endonuclease-like RecB superfamily